MIIVLFVVLIALTFGFVFAKLDTLYKASKILRDEIQSLQKDIENIKNKSKD